jgi:inhibitor of cysteine peptidase
LRLQRAPNLASLEDAVSELFFAAKDSGTEARVPVRGRFQIRLEENPTTGYQWTAPDVDANCLHLESNTFTRNDSAGVGGGGIRQFDFSVIAPCRTAIHLAYKRPWETTAAARRTFDLTIVGTP